MILTLEQNQYFDTMDEMFMSPGWKMFIEDVEGFHEAMEGQFDSVKDLRELGLAQGRKMTFQQILNYQSVVEGAKKSLQDAPEEVVDTNETIV